jgi:hypothetical protein
MGKVRVRLTHNCNMREHPGIPGDVIEGVDEELAKSWEAKGGGRIVGDDVKPTRPSKPAKGDETAKEKK